MYSQSKLESSQKSRFCGFFFSLLFFFCWGWGGCSFYIIHNPCLSQMWYVFRFKCWTMNWISSNYNTIESVIKCYSNKLSMAKKKMKCLFLLNSQMQSFIPHHKKQNIAFNSLLDSIWLKMWGKSGDFLCLTFQIQFMVNSWSVSVFTIKPCQRVAIFAVFYLFIFVILAVVVRGSLWTVDQQLSLSDKLPAKEKEREQKKTSEIKSRPTALYDWEGLCFTVKSRRKREEVAVNRMGMAK